MQGLQGQTSEELSFGPQPRRCDVFWSNSSVAGLEATLIDVVGPKIIGLSCVSVAIDTEVLAAR
eukprot:1980402-Amphidinium_carterae.1